MVFKLKGLAAGWRRRSARIFLRASGFSDGGGGRKNQPSCGGAGGNLQVRVRECAGAARDSFCDNKSRGIRNV